MNQFFKALSVLSLVALGIAACSPSESDKKAQQQEIKQDLTPVFMTEKDGVKVYRFLDPDSYHFVYFTVGNSTGTRFTMPNGKTTRQVEVPNEQ